MLLRCPSLCFPFLGFCFCFPLTQLSFASCCLSFAFFLLCFPFFSSDAPIGCSDRGALGFFTCLLFRNSIAFFKANRDIIPTIQHVRLALLCFCFAFRCFPLLSSPLLSRLLSFESAFLCFAFLFFPLLCICFPIACLCLPCLSFALLSLRFAFLCLDWLWFSCAFFCFALLRVASL